MNNSRALLNVIHLRRKIAIVTRHSAVITKTIDSRRLSKNSLNLSETWHLLGIHTETDKSLPTTAEAAAAAGKAATEGRKKANKKSSVKWSLMEWYSRRRGNMGRDG